MVRFDVLVAVRRTLGEDCPGALSGGQHANNIDYVQRSVQLFPGRAWPSNAGKQNSPDEFPEVEWRIHSTQLIGA